MLGEKSDDTSCDLRKKVAECRKLMDSQPMEAMKMARSAAESARELGNNQLLGEALIYLSRTISITDSGHRSIDIAREAVNVLAGNGDTVRFHGMALNNLGNCLRRTDSFIDAIDAYEKAKQIYSKIGYTDGLSSVLNNMGIAYSEIGHYQKAYQSFEDSIEVLGSGENNQRKATSLSNIASILIWQGEYEAAEEVLLESLQVNTEIGRKTGTAYCYSQLGLLKARMDDHPKAVEYFNWCVSVWKELGSRKDLVRTMCSLAESLEKMGNIKEARVLLEEAYSEADNPGMDLFKAMTTARMTCLRFRMGEREGIREELLSVLELPKDSQEHVTLMREILETLAEYYTEKEDFKSAMDYRTRSFQHQREEWKKKEQEDIVRFRHRIEFEKLQLERDKLRNRKDQLEEANRKLQEALQKVKTLSGMLPICANCNKIRNDEGYWEKIERYITEHSQAVFSHSLCPECMVKLYPDLDLGEVLHDNY
jgi:tetratricopeptide (TPR) repeat protein